VIRRLVRDLNISTEIVGVPTVRDPDGLALSSRNAYLSEAERRQALALPRALEAARAALLSGSAVAEVLEEARNSLLDGGFSRVDYFALVDPETLAPIDALRDGASLIAAAAMGSTRLIDNLPV
jgi:pantoate--beta-alanine ligase